jgi:hypothetical protein
MEGLWGSFGSVVGLEEVVETCNVSVECPYKSFARRLKSEPVFHDSAQPLDTVQRS